ncbi:hypothetical protein L798_06232 [Zootermopsis nevadensis]|uniref:Odorant receptor n=2 Tax=Zootermopsis nevadensis TaxID=136037 RepID=A0A067RIN5_ZOONE|nr:hypothetical protein L798_06232 [Zootermopsis nevadensis]
MNARKINAKAVSENRFRKLLLTLRSAGIPLNTHSITTLRSAYNVIVPVSFYITCLSGFMDFLVSSDLKELMKSSRVVFGMGVVMWQHFFLSYRKRDIEHLISLTDSFTWEEVPTRDPETGRLTMVGYIQIAQSFARYYPACILLIHFLQSGVRMVRNREMMITKWYPFDSSASPAYEIVNLTQVFAAILIACVFGGFLSLYATLVCVACSQLEKLKGALLDIRQTHIILQQDCGAETNGEEHPHTPEEVFHRMQKQLNDCIRHHQQIKQFMQAFEDSWSTVQCGVFLLILTALCSVVFSFITSWGDHVDLVQATLIFLHWSCILILTCWLGNELSVLAESVRDAAWGCDWVGTPVPFQRCLIFIIAVANKEFALTAGKFVPVSNSTMLNMMNQSISFFMFLLYMKDNNREANHGI